MANLSNINNKFLVTTGGNVLIGQTAAVGTSKLQITGSGDTVAKFNRLSSDGEIIRFEQDNGTDGAINSLSGRIAIGSSTIGIFFDSIRDVVTPHNMTTNTYSANISLGRDLIRFKDLYLSGIANIAGSVTAGDYRSPSGDTLYITSGLDWRFRETGGAERMRIDSSGRVGIGVTPSYANVPLHTKNIGGGDSFNIFEGIGNAWVFGEADQTGRKYCQVAGRYGHHSGINVDLVGNVGIGTTSNTTKKLEVAGSYKLGTNAWIQYDAAYPYTISMLNSAGVGNLILNAGYGSSGFESKIELQGGNTTGAAGITLSTGSSTRMVVTADGKIGLGKTDPFYPVDATSFGANTHEWGSGLALFGQDRYSIRELNNLFYSADSRVGGIGTSSNVVNTMFDGNFDTGHSIAANTTYVVELDGSGVWSLTYPSGYATISFYYIYTNFTSIVGEQYHYGGTYAGQWRTMGTPVDIRGSAGSTRVVRINSAGNNYVSKWRFTFVTGSTSINVTDIAFYGTRTAGAPVSTYMRGDRTNEWTRMIRFRNNANGIVGSIAPGNTSTAFNTTSDYRLKEDLRDFKGLDMISKIPVYDFRWINSEKRSHGVLAHELNEIYPEAVEGEKDEKENQCVDYSKIVPLLVKSIQELKAEIELLKSK